MPTIFAIRHGPTAFNDENRLRGWMDPPLNNIGRNVALAAHKTLCDFGAHTLPIYSSDLLRAKQTADVLGPYTSHMELRPWNVGIYAGQPGAIVHPRLVQYQQSGICVPFGERWDDFVKRFMTFVLALPRRCVIVTHYRCCKLLQAWCNGNVNMDILLRDDVTTGQVLQVEL